MVHLLEQDPSWVRLPKPSNELVNWFHASEDGRRITSEYFIRPEDRELLAIATFGPKAEGHGGLAHGGALLTLLDDAMGTCAWLAGAVVVTARLETDFRRPILLGTPVEARCRVTRSEGRKVWVHCEVVSAAGVHVEAEGLWVQRRGE